MEVILNVKSGQKKKNRLKKVPQLCLYWFSTITASWAVNMLTHWILNHHQENNDEAVYWSSAFILSKLIFDKKLIYFVSDGVKQTVVLHFPLFRKNSADNFSIRSRNDSIAIKMSSDFQISVIISTSSGSCYFDCVALNLSFWTLTQWKSLFHRLR